MLRATGRWSRATIQDKSHRPVIGQRHIHHGTELPRFHLYVLAAQLLNKTTIKLFPLLGFGRPVKRRAAALAAIAVQRELGNNEDLRADLGQRQVHFPVRILEYPYLRDLLRQINGILLGVALAYTDEDQHAAADPADHLPIDPDLRLTDPLHDDFHEIG